MSVHYITNRNDYYIKVIGDFDINKLEGCKLHSTLDDLYQHAASIHNLSVDEVSGLEIIIDIEKNTEWIHGLGDLDAMMIEDGADSIEDYISNLVL